jgi:hypothetical protein
MRSLIKSRDYLIKSLGFVLLFGFISLGAIGGCNDSEGAGLGDSNNSATVFVSVTETCNDIPMDGSCFKIGPECPGLSAVTGGGCECEYIDGTGKSLGPAPISLSVPAFCQGNVEVGAPCLTWECTCFNATDDDVSIAATTYAICL